ncbi:hypothetical protein L1887_31000 [Cichorium endivia]|nr:hypothetical protein L1887_31000 [Cichorium endivia]
MFRQRQLLVGGSLPPLGCLTCTKHKIKVMISKEIAFMVNSRNLNCQINYGISRSSIVIQEIEQRCVRGRIYFGGEMICKFGKVAHDVSVDGLKTNLAPLSATNGEVGDADSVGIIVYVGLEGGDSPE